LHAKFYPDQDLKQNGFFYLPNALKHTSGLFIYSQIV